MRKLVSTILAASILCAVPVAVSAADGKPAAAVVFGEDSGYKANTYTGFIEGVGLDTKAGDILAALTDSEGISIVSGDRTLGADDKVSTGCVLRLSDAAGAAKAEFKTIVPGDVNGDGKTEFLISWNMISYSTSHLMSVYKMTGSGQESKLTALAEPMQYSAYIPADLNNDGVQEVLFFSADQMKSLSASAALYSYKGDKQTLLGETRVDGHVSAYRKLQVGKADGKPALNVDLWQQLLPLLQTHTVTFNWVKGHAGHPYNERCDALAVQEYTKHK